MAVGSGQSMQELLLLVQTEEAVDPPVPPAGAHGLSLSDTPVPEHCLEGSESVCINAPGTGCEVHALWSAATSVFPGEIPLAGFT